VKPANLGSSVGISKVKKDKELAAAINLAAEFDLKVIVEAAVPAAREIECGVLGNGRPDASVAGEIVPAGEFYDYDAKYISSGSRLEIPADIPAVVAEEVRRLAIDAFEAIDGSGLARVDFLLNRERDELYINEINTLPGFTTISMYSKLWAASGVDYPTLVDRLVTLALERHAEKRTLRTSMF
jgi:D-alanine-D-alanine ligase